MSKPALLLSLVIVLGILIRNGQSQTPTTAPTTTATSAPTTTGTPNTAPTTTVTGITSTGTTGSITASTTSSPFSTVSTASTSTGSTISTSVLPTAQIGGTYGSCPVLPPAPNVTLQNLVGTWYVMRYQPATAGEIVDKCDRIQISTSQITLFSKPGNSIASNYQTETAIVQPNVTQGTFLYTLPGFGDQLQGYVTILSYSSIGFIYNVCWLNSGSNLNNLVLCATSQVDPTAFAGLVANASYWESQWSVSMQQVNQNGC